MLILINDIIRINYRHPINNISPPPHPTPTFKIIQKIYNVFGDYTKPTESTQICDCVIWSNLFSVCLFVIRLTLIVMAYEQLTINTELLQRIKINTYLTRVTTNKFIHIADQHIGHHHLQLKSTTLNNTFTSNTNSSKPFLITHCHIPSHSPFHLHSSSPFPCIHPPLLPPPPPILFAHSPFPDQRL